MYQHQHALLPLEELKAVPQPVIVLLEVLLEKDPARRFQNPAELLKAVPTITDPIDTGRITREHLHRMPPAASRASTRKPAARLGPKKISVARLPVTGSDVFGRTAPASTNGCVGGMQQAALSLLSNARTPAPK